jgi:hypothetical protein
MKETQYFSPLPFSPCLNPAGGFGAPRLNLTFSPCVKVAGFRRLGSPLEGFLPNTEISFLMISPKLLDICPVFLLDFLLLKQRIF